MMLETKAVDILILLRSYKKNLYQSKIVKLADCSVGQTSKILTKFVKLNIIKKELAGQRIYITLKSKGKKIADELIKIKELLK